MALSEAQSTFLETHHSAAMITIGDGSLPKAVRVGVETTVTILDGPNAPALNLNLFRVMQNRPRGPLSWFGGQLDEEAAFLRTMTEEGRLIYEFEVHRSYAAT
jgi:hypothetical protein